MIDEGIFVLLFIFCFVAFMAALGSCMMAETDYFRRGQCSQICLPKPYQVIEGKCFCLDPEVQLPAQQK